ncbi:MAG: nucleoside hydrolase [Desulfovibrio sp.]|jgi:inosine-uridine nucleoside N-ribohydrolase|nr:nucleoside hydrolase [Desulfovibrio sp.]
MKNTQHLVFFIFLLFLLTGHAPFALSKESVLMDSDMEDSFDDGVAMVLLANAPGVDLVGVTTLSGNYWVAESVASAVRQLEIEGKSFIPVAAGLAYPLRPNRHELFALERNLLGAGHDSWLGSFGLPEPKSWQEVYTKRYGLAPTAKPIDKHAVDFIIDSVRANPGQITVAATGPCGNLALAVRKAPDIIPLIKRVVYMGGSFYKPGNITPAAEFNWFFDPEAAKMAVRTPFREQIIIGLDVCEKIIFRRAHYDRLLKTLGKSGQAQLLRNSFLGQSFEKNPDFTFFVWDVLVSAVIIDPSIIIREENVFIDVNDQYGLSYGQSLAYRETAPAGAQRARVVLDIDEKRFWDILNDKTYWASARQ